MRRLSPGAPRDSSREPSGLPTAADSKFMTNLLNIIKVLEVTILRLKMTILMRSLKKDNQLLI